ncbi:Transglycosylase associated protein [Candidatus Pantoea varia]|uniref:Transglycosylase associated protein n=1 Tax=Candidatus Pantoea varia TaxID=1881036 RepID=A0A1I5AFZ9_9GAMM|nr:GlsB/YeaQ/YmgE family stress response membrane protein [Pantoea varia]SFN61139.1 Transglycosylase associated protein [Pantoea varia]
MALLVWLLSGLLLGLLKRLLMPGPPGSLVATLTLSMIGALIGGYIATYFELGTLATFHIGALVMAIIGAVVMLLVAARLRI